MKAWIGPVMAAAQTAHERNESALRNPAGTSEPGTEGIAGGVEGDPSAPGSAAKAAPEASGRRGFLGWWRRWRW